MKLILVPLLVMFVASLLNISTLQPFTTNSTSAGAQSGAGTNRNTTSVTGAFTASNVVLIVGSVIAVMLVIAIAASLNVLGSGLTAGAARIIVMLTMFSIFWGILSFTGLPIVLAVPFGGIVYIILTIIYLDGVLQAVSGLGGGNA